MQTNILWTGREYYSLEHCSLNASEVGADVLSTIVGRYGDKIYTLRYQLKTNSAWQTVFVKLNYRQGSIKEEITLESDGNGNWTMGGKPAEQFKGCIDVDISLTPFTNTLPINRLRLTPGQDSVTHVIYFDMLEQQVRPVSQKYTCHSATQYLYENVPNDFNALVEVDAMGLVVDYPGLFTRSAVQIMG